MDGKFKKVNVIEYGFYGGGGLYCNNIRKDLVRKFMRTKFGTPNGNSLREDESTWKYVLCCELVYLTVYDYGDTWSVGFVEEREKVSDYEKTKSFANMLCNYLKEGIKESSSFVQEGINI